MGKKTGQVSPLVGNIQSGGHPQGPQADPSLPGAGRGGGWGRTGRWARGVLRDPTTAFWNSAEVVEVTQQ